jgi:opacity protein-like surface antigen
LVKSGVPCLRPHCSLPLALLLILVAIATRTMAQSPDTSPWFGRKNTISFFAAYSNDSSHILLGSADNRKLLDFGAGYNRRLIMNRIVNWQYSFELLPVALESDPLEIETIQQTVPTVLTSTLNLGSQALNCTPQSTAYSFTTAGGVTYAGTESFSCSGREWTIGEGISPIGFQWNFMTRDKIQPFLIGHGGYMYSTQPIPLSMAGSFNFTFDLGAGVEIFQNKTRSIRVEYRYHHISNHDTATENPGIDSGLFQLSYSFGR